MYYIFKRVCFPVMMKNVIDNPISNYCKTHSGFEGCMFVPGMFHVILYPAFNCIIVSFYQFPANGVIHVRWVILPSMTHLLLPSFRPSAIQIGKHLLNKQTQAALKILACLHHGTKKGLQTQEIHYTEGDKTTHKVHVFFFGGGESIMALMKLHFCVCNN